MGSYIKSFEDMIKQSYKNFEQGRAPQKFTRWKYCVALAARGWKAYEAEKINEPDSDDIIVKWRKDGEEEIQIRLSFTEQCLWLEYLEQKEKNK